MRKLEDFPIDLVNACEPGRTLTWR